MESEEQEDIQSIDLSDEELQESQMEGKLEKKKIKKGPGQKKGKQLTAQFGKSINRSSTPKIVNLSEKKEP